MIMGPGGPSSNRWGFCESRGRFGGLVTGTGSLALLRTSFLEIHFCESLCCAEPMTMIFCCVKSVVPGSNLDHNQNKNPTFARFLFWFEYVQSN